MTAVIAPQLASLDPDFEGVKEMERLDILEEASRVAERYLAIVAAINESRSVQRGSRHVCDCASCRAQRRDTLAWVDAMTADSRPRQAA